MEKSGFHCANRNWRSESVLFELHLVTCARRSLEGGETFSKKEKLLSGTL